MKHIVMIVLVALSFSAMTSAQEKADDWSVLVGAIMDGNTAALREAIRAGRDLNAKDAKTGQTPLHIAVAIDFAKRDTTSVKILLEAGADANAVNSVGGTPLFYAYKLNDLTLMKLLLRHGAKTDIPITQVGQTVLHVAAYEGHAEVVRILLEAKAAVDVVSKSGQTPLFFAIKEKEVLSSLLAASANPNAKDESGLTPLFYAANNGNLDIVKALIGAGAYPNARDPKGRTPADWAIRNGNIDVAAYLNSDLVHYSYAQEAYNVAVSKATWISSAKPDSRVRMLRVDFSIQNNSSESLVLPDSTLFYCTIIRGDRKSHDANEIFKVKILHTLTLDSELDKSKIPIKSGLYFHPHAVPKGLSIKPADEWHSFDESGLIVVPHGKYKLRIDAGALVKLIAIFSINSDSDSIDFVISGFQPIGLDPK